MKDDLYINDAIVIPGHELEITTSRAGGPGGQHVNKTQTRVTVHWNVQKTSALSHEEKERVLRKLQARLTTAGDLIIHNNSSRSQHHNKTAALANMAKEVRKALHIPKKRMARRISVAAKESRLQEKAHRSAVKKMRKARNHED